MRANCQRKPRRQCRLVPLHGGLSGVGCRLVVVLSLFAVRINVSVQEAAFAQLCVSRARSCLSCPYGMGGMAMPSGRPLYARAGVAARTGPPLPPRQRTTQQSLAQGRGGQFAKALRIDPVL